MNADLKEYLVTVSVKAARGTQMYTVNATSAEDAVSRFHNGEGEFVDQEIEVTDLGEAEAELNT